MFLLGYEMSLSWLFPSRAKYFTVLMLIGRKYLHIAVALLHQLWLIALQLCLSKCLCCFPRCLLMDVYFITTHFITNVFNYSSFVPYKMLYYPQVERYCLFIREVLFLMFIDKDKNSLVGIECMYRNSKPKYVIR